MRKASCGLSVCNPVEIPRVLKTASDCGFEFICLPLVHPRFKREFTDTCTNRPGPFTRPDLVLNSNEWNSLIAGKLSPYLNIESELLKGQAKFALEQELNYGNHLDVPAVIISIKTPKFYNLARIISSTLAGPKPYQVWVEIPMVSPRQEAAVWRSDVAQEELKESTWEWWYKFYSLCNLDKRVGLVLDLPKILPEKKEIDRWMGEPIKCVIISTSVFLTNRKGYPVLSKAHQALLKSMVSFDLQVIIKGNNHHFNLDCYQKYIDHLWEEATIQQNSKLESVAADEHPFYCFLHPFVDISSRTYELLEKDSFKYRAYTKAIYLAIAEQYKNEQRNTRVLNVMVFNAGRGPLVISTLIAAVNADRRVKVYAVEKNPHDIVTLLGYKEEYWYESVEVIHENFRNLEFPPIIDLFVCDALGSFGDNELLPEMLSIARKYLKSTGATVPQSCSSYICPVQCSKIYGDLRGAKEGSFSEIPYYISKKNKYSISPAKPLFAFKNLKNCESTDFSRYKTLTFDVEQKSVVHGIIGYFETILYDDVKLTTLPGALPAEKLHENPIFFPISEQVHLNAGDIVTVHFWRMVGAKDVWYEWTITDPVSLPIHNSNGRSCKIALD